jgi:DNA-binding NarL/FixJ family response regulator
MRVDPLSSRVPEPVKALILSESPDAFSSSTKVVAAKKVKLMIIKDQHETNFAAIDELQCAGYEIVYHRKELASTLVMVMTERPDLILIDVDQSPGNEMMLCRLIKKNRLVAETPVLLYSSLEKKDLNRKVRLCEAQGYVPKNSGNKKLRKRIEKYLAEQAMTTLNQ